MSTELFDSIKKALHPSHVEGLTIGENMTRILASWAAVIAGLNLGDVATLAAIVYTSLNIIFLLYDRLFKPRLAAVTVPVEETQGQGE